MRIAYARPADQIIGGKDNPYLLRWYALPRNRWFNVYVHRFLRSDDDRALHDHPWLNASILLVGRYTEHSIAAGGIEHRHVRATGDVKVRRAVAAHRIELTDGPCWSLFLTGPRIRDWGFHCPTRWVVWRDFVDPNDSGAIGPGCGEP